MIVRFILVGTLISTLNPFIEMQAQPVEVSTERYEALVGLYELEDGRLAEIFDLIDQVQSHQLTLVEPTSGRIRTLYPTSDSTFYAGPAWFVDSPASYELRFHMDADDRVTNVTWTEDEQTLSGKRIHFREREVSFVNRDVSLSGTLVLPAGEGPFPAMIMVHGSGPLTRRSPRYVADLFAHKGIAVLVYDKRGTGASTGEWNGAAHEDLAGDVQAGLDLLRIQPDVDPKRVGIYAASEGGFVAPLVATRDPDVAFLICRVCAGLPHGPVIVDMEGGAMQRSGMSETEVAHAVEYLGLQIDYALHRKDRLLLEERFKAYEGESWMERYRITGVPAPDAPFWDGYRGLLSVEPLPLYAELHIPILIILGELDNRILLDKNQAAFEEARRRSGNPDFAIWALPQASHGLLVVETDSLGQQLPFERYVPAFHDQMVAWLVERMN